MKLTSAIFFGFAALTAYVQATPVQPSPTPTTGEFTRAPGNVVDTSKPHNKLFKRDAAADGEILNLDLDTISAPIQPGDPQHGTLPSHSAAVRGRSVAKISCPRYAPWICEGVTCMNIFTHNCCKGGHLCKDPDVCVRDVMGYAACHKN
ncbi:hypothetical protein FQN49_002915 [Arthroderma sp. PD_2]|nr:hypothetical protein FQN49_002915 [Arthroderma sp. PD_2]